MTERNLSNVESPKGASYQVKWHDKGGEVFVKRKTGMMSTWRKCNRTAHSEGDALDVAKRFVRDLD